MDMENSKPKESGSAPAPAPAPAAKAPEAAAAPAAPAPVEAPQGVVPVTKANAPGGWNRFAGYKREDNRNNDKGRRDGHRGRR
jgi:hypothetical protein